MDYYQRNDIISKYGEPGTPPEPRIENCPECGSLEVDNSPGGEFENCIVCGYKKQSNQ